MEDRILRMTIAFLSSCYDKGDVENLVSVASFALKKQLAYISKLNVRSSMILSKIAEVEKDVYIDSIRKKTSELSNYAVSDELMEELGTYIDYLVAELQSDIMLLENSNEAEEGVLDIYNLTGDNSELPYRRYQNDDPTFMKYFASKDTMKYILDICASFTDMKNTINSSLSSKNNSLCVHFDLILKNISKLLRYHLDIYQKEKDVFKAASLTLLCYNHYGWTGENDAEDFLSRNAFEIQADLEDLL